MAVPIIIVILLVLALLVGCILITKGLCCDSCYDKVDRIKKYQKKPGQNQSQADPEQPGQQDANAGNYASMTSKEKKDGKKNVYVDDSGNTVNRPSLLNFDITGDVTTI